MLAANKFSALSCSCPGLCSDVAYLLPLCAAVACFFFFSQSPLKLEQCLHTGTSDNPANNSFTSLVRSCAASIRLLHPPFSLFPPQFPIAVLHLLAVEKAVTLPEAVRLPQCRLFHG